MTEKLLPCPFCGGEARQAGETFERTILQWVYCTSCGAASGYQHTEAEAIAAWNTRTHIGYSLDEETVSKLIDAYIESTERTCRIVDIQEDWQYGFGVKDYEFSCGHVICWAHISEPSYCPNCGAKVVN